VAGLVVKTRIIRPAGDLGPFDLAVPIGAFDQPNHQPAAGIARQRRQCLDHAGRALLVRLNGKTQSRPVAKRRLARQAVQQFEGQDQPVGFLGIQREIDVRLGCQSRQTKQARIKLLPYPFFLVGFIARGKRRELDRDTVTGQRASPLARAYGPDRRRIGGLEPLGIGRRPRAFSQHIEGTEEVFLSRPRQRRLDAIAQDN